MTCGYITVEDLRAEGVSEDDYPDSVIEARIAYAIALLEAYTGRFFEPRAMTIELDGTGSRVQPVGPPIISVDRVVILIGHPSDPITTSEFEDDEIVVYNRHITQGLTHPDDRENPRLDIEIVRSSRYASLSTFPQGSGNVRITGVFGYTDPVAGEAVSQATEPFALFDGATLIVRVDGGDPQEIVFSAVNFPDITAATAAQVAAYLKAFLVGATACARSDGSVSIKSKTVRGSSSIEIVGGTAAGAFAFPPGAQGFPEGVTPPLIRRALMLMVLRDLPPLTDEDGERDERQNEFRVTEMRTRDQTVKYGLGMSGGGNNRGHQFVGYFTGDPEIDKILAMYVRPPDLGMVGGRSTEEDILEIEGIRY